MSARHERLGRLVRLRRATHRLARTELAARLADERAAEAGLERASETTSAWARTLLREGEVLEGQGLRDGAAWLGELQRWREAAEAARERAAQEAGRAAARYGEARRQLHVVERLQARWRAVWLGERDRREQRWLDDLYLSGWSGGGRGERR